MLPCRRAATIGTAGKHFSSEVGEVGFHLLPLACKVAAGIKKPAKRFFVPTLPLALNGPNRGKLPLQLGGLRARCGVFRRKPAVAGAQLWACAPVWPMTSGNRRKITADRNRVID
ncbi:hypothetical protein EN41_05010 [Agrobacterium tumefaciens]|nr:hypothetical protein EN41_05010 [Agrobacterium tumefaciens]